MDLNVHTLLDATYLIPIAITLRKIYAPCFDTPAPIAAAVARLDGRSRDAGRVSVTRSEPAVV